MKIKVFLVRVTRQWYYFNICIETSNYLKRIFVSGIFVCRQLIICLYNFIKYGDIAWTLLAGLPDIAALNSQNNKGFSALMVAITNRAPVQFIRSLLVLGAKLSQIDMAGNTAIHYAVLTMDIKYLKALILPFSTDEMELGKLYFNTYIHNRQTRKSALLTCLQCKNKQWKTPQELALQQSFQHAYIELFGTEEELTNE